MDGYNNEALEWLGANLQTVERKLRTVCRLQGRRFDALWDDICSDIVVPRVSEVYAKWVDDGGASRMTWVVNGLKHKVRNYVAKRSGYRQSVQVVAIDNGDPDTVSSVDQISIEKFSEETSATAVLDVLKDVMEALPETARYWLLFRASGMTFVEMGESLDLAEATVRGHYAAALETARRIARRLA